MWKKHSATPEDKTVYVRLCVPQMEKHPERDTHTQRESPHCLLYVSMLLFSLIPAVGPVRKGGKVDYI